MTAEGNRDARRRPLPAILVSLAALVVVLLCAAYFFYIRSFYFRQADSNFLVEPYLQLGKTGDVKQPELVWATSEFASRWQVLLKQGAHFEQLPREPESHRVAIGRLSPFRIFEAPLPPLSPDRPARYRVTRDGATVFESAIKSVEPASDFLRVDVVGDIGSGSVAQKGVAVQMYQSEPNLVVVAGDIVYSCGRTSEYLARFFPVYNSEDSSKGVPMLRRVVFAAAPGNHDTDPPFADRANIFDLLPDAFAYFLWWKQPLNGPALVAGGSDTPDLGESQDRKREYREACGQYFPREENFSFDLANTHWTILDADVYVNWNHRELRAWLERDLKAASGKLFKFVVFHQSCFSSDPIHFYDQQMRLLTEIFERQHVDVVFAGHAHNYQRTYPLSFTPLPGQAEHWTSSSRAVQGAFKLDRAFDGKTDTQPSGIIYITTGGGGAELYSPQAANDRQRWLPFTCKFIARHSFTQCDIKSGRLHIRQIAADGSILDDLVLQKPEAVAPQAGRS